MSSQILRQKFNWVMLLVIIYISTRYCQYQYYQLYQYQVLLVANSTSYVWMLNLSLTQLSTCPHVNQCIQLVIILLFYCRWCNSSIWCYFQHFLYLMIYIYFKLFWFQKATTCYVYFLFTIIICEIYSEVYELKQLDIVDQPDVKKDSFWKPFIQCQKNCISLMLAKDCLEYLVKGNDIYIYIKTIELLGN